MLEIGLTRWIRRGIGERRTLRSPPMLFAGVLSVPVPPLIAVVLPDEAMIADMW
jgi:hypothetical protein